MDPQQEDVEAQRQWREARDRRLAERQAEQERAHEADPYNVPKYLPVDDLEFPDESYTAGWQDEGDDWDGDSNDAADSEADDLDVDPSEDPGSEFAAVDNGWLGRLMEGD